MTEMTHELRGLLSPDAPLGRNLPIAVGAALALAGTFAAFVAAVEPLDQGRWFTFWYYVIRMLPFFAVWPAALVCHEVGWPVAPSVAGYFVACVLWPVLPLAWLHGELRWSALLISAGLSVIFTVIFGLDLGRRRRMETTDQIASTHAAAERS